MQRLKRVAYLIFYPTIWLSNRLDILQKYSLIIIINIFAITYLSFSYLDELEYKTQNNQQTLDALHLSKALFSFMTSLQQTRGMMNSQLRGVHEFDRQLYELKIQNKGYANQIDEIIHKKWTHINITQQYQNIKNRLDEIFAGGLEKDPDATFNALTRTIEQIVQFINLISNFTNSSLDKGKNNITNTQLLYHILPSLVEAHGQLRGIGTGILSDKSLNKENKKALTLIRHHFFHDLQDMHTFEQYYDSVDYIAHKYSLLELPQSIRLLDKILQEEDLSISAKEYFEVFSKDSRVYLDEYDMHYKELNEHINTTIQIQKKHRFFAYVAIWIILFLVLYLLIGILITSNLFKSAFLNTTKKIAQGELGSRLEIYTHNEYGAIANDLNKMLEYLEQTTKTINKYVDTFQTDLNGNITSVSDAFAQHCGYSEKELIGKHHNILHHPDAPVTVYTKMWNKVKRGEEWKGELLNRCKDGSDFWVNASVVPLYDEQEEIRGYMSICQDITNQKRVEELSITDFLTQIYNRKYFNEKLKKMISLYHRYQTPFSLIMIDIDFFKKVNDTYGHLVGDSTLVQMSALLKTHLRENDVLARWGGEEFMILLSHTHKDEAIKIANKLRSLVEQHLFDDTYKMTISLGVSHFLDDDSFDTILERIDRALYQSKKEGRNMVTYL